jgi:hypothetical protein
LIILKAQACIVHYPSMTSILIATSYIPYKLLKSWHCQINSSKVHDIMQITPEKLALSILHASKPNTLVLTKFISQIYTNLRKIWLI